MTLTLVPLALVGSPATALGKLAAFGQPGPLAVTRTGQVYVTSGRELYRLNGDRPVPVAQAAGTIECVVASDSGAIYLGERDQLQKVSPTGHVSVVTRAHVTGLGRGPQGSTYVVTDAAVSRLVNQQLVPVVRRSQFVGVSHVPTQISALTFANVALDAHGNIYITASGVGFSLFEVTRSGNVRYIGPARAGDPHRLVETPTRDPLHLGLAPKLLRRLEAVPRGEGGMECHRQRSSAAGDEEMPCRSQQLCASRRDPMFMESPAQLER
jgi:hypothetical protein